MSSKEKMQQWEATLPAELRQQIDSLVDEISEHMDKIVRHEERIDDLIKRFIALFDETGIAREQTSAFIKHKLKGIVSDDTIERHLPEDRKRKHKPYERYQNVQSANEVIQEPVTVASDGSTIPEHIASESYTKPDGSEGEREGEPIDEEGTPFELYEGDREHVELDEDAAKKVQEIENTIFSTVDYAVAANKELNIRLEEALKLADDKDKRIYELEMQAGEFEVRIGDLNKTIDKMIIEKKPSAVNQKQVDTIEELTIERDNLKLALHEMREIERARIKESGFTTASQLPKQVWVAAVNAMNFYVTLNKASKHATANNDPWRKIVFDVDKDGQLKAAKLESTGQGGGEFQV